MTGQRSSVPPVILTYGLLGILPFLAPALAGALWPALKPAAAHVLALYGGLILSFLGGARWGLAIPSVSLRTGIVSLAMLPTLAGLALLVLPVEARWIQLMGLGLALALHWLWDVSAQDVPVWYPRLRTILTAGAVVGLISGALVLT